MKKLYIIILTLSLLLITAQAACAEDFMLWKGGLEWGNVHLTPSNDTGNYLSDSGSSGFSLNAEYVSELDENLEMGLGVKIHNITLQSRSDQATFIPLYLILDYYPFKTDGFLYFTAQAGYNIIFLYNSYYSYDDYDDWYDTTVEYDISNYSGGLYFGFGAGIKVTKNLRLEAIYTVLNGSCHFNLDEYYYGDYEYDDLPYLPATSEFDAIISDSSFKITLSLGL